MNKKVITGWSLLSLAIFIICDILMTANYPDLVKSLSFVIVMYGGLLVAGWLKWRLAYHLLGVVVGLYTLSFLAIIKHIGTQVTLGWSGLTLGLAVMGIIVNLLWYRIAIHQLKIDYVRIVAKKSKK